MLSKTTHNWSSQLAGLGISDSLRISPRYQRTAKSVSSASTVNGSDALETVSEAERSLFSRRLFLSARIKLRKPSSPAREYFLTFFKNRLHPAQLVLTVAGCNPSPIAILPGASVANPEGEGDRRILFDGDPLPKSPPRALFVLRVLLRSEFGSQVIVFFSFVLPYIVYKDGVECPR